MTFPLGGDADFICLASAADGGPLQPVQNSLFKFRSDLPVFTDGSCLTSRVPSLRRAGAAAVQISPLTLQPVAVMAGPLWSPLPQTAPAAEAFALAMVADFAETGSKLKVLSDCLAVVHSAANWARATRASSLLSGFYRHIRCSSGFQALSEVHKVAAHQDLAGLSGASLHDATGNSVADRYAVQAARSHPAISADRQSEHRILVRVARASASVMHGVWDSFPRITGLSLLPRLPPCDRGPRRERDTHYWELASPPTSITVCSVKP